MVQLAGNRFYVCVHVFRRTGYILQVPRLRSDQVGTHRACVQLKNGITYEFPCLYVIREGRITSGDQLMPLFVLDTMANIPGLTGLFLAGVCSSALCSVSAALNSLAAVTLEDYITVIFYIYIVVSIVVSFAKVIVNLSLEVMKGGPKWSIKIIRE